MPTKIPVSTANEMRMEMPPQLMEVFAKSPRIVIKHHPAGLWPVDPGIIRKVDIAALVADKNFSEKFEVVIMPK